MRSDSPRRSTVQPYQANTQWTFSSRRSEHTRTVELVLYAEPDGSSMSDDYRPEDTSAQELWRMWADRYAHAYHRDYPSQYRPGEVPIYWYVTQPTFRGTFEASPHAPNALSEDFLSHYTHPRHAETGDPVNWLRLPVLDRGWNAAVADKGGFIQEATGWKPSPLQPTMDVAQIAAAASLYMPKPN